jgi:four helix bundle protein
MINDESNLNVQISNDQNGHGRFDLEERTAVFGENCIRFGKKIGINPVTYGILSQFVRAATSVGANYSEANDAESKKDFRHKIGICRKESKETKFWLRMIATADPSLRDEAAGLWQEAKELNLIFSSIVRKCDRKR